MKKLTNLTKKYNAWKQKIKCVSYNSFYLLHFLDLVHSRKKIQALDTTLENKMNMAREYNTLWNSVHKKSSDFVFIFCVCVFFMKFPGKLALTQIKKIKIDHIMIFACSSELSGGTEFFPMQPPQSGCPVLWCGRQYVVDHRGVPDI